MRSLPLLLLLSACDVSDLGKTEPSTREQYCTHQAHLCCMDGWYDDATYQKCMFGEATAPDGGARD